MTPTIDQARARVEKRLGQSLAEGGIQSNDDLRVILSALAAAESRATEAEALLVECAAVLEPFADVAADIDPDGPRTGVCPDDAIAGEASYEALTIGHCRAASTLLAKLTARTAGDQAHD